MVAIRELLEKSSCVDATGDPGSMDEFRLYPYYSTRKNLQFHLVVLRGKCFLVRRLHRRTLSQQIFFVRLAAYFFEAQIFRALCPGKSEQLRRRRGCRSSSGTRHGPRGYDVCSHLER